MRLTQMNRRKRCVNIPCSKTGTHKRLSLSVEDTRPHTNTTTKHALMLIMSLWGKKASLRKRCHKHSYLGTRNTQTPKRSTQINRGKTVWLFLILTIEMPFTESSPQPLQICLSETVLQNGWLILKLPRVLKEHNHVFAHAQEEGGLEFKDAGMSV